VLCGSYRRNPAELREELAALIRAGCAVLSPESVDFVDEVDGFVLTEAEVGQEPTAVEARHIAALRSADFVWLHVPGGYVGASAALELGVAHGLDIPVFSARRPNDPLISEFVRVVPSPVDAVDWARDRLRTPAGPLRDLQSYYGRMAAMRGFSAESPQDTMLLLTEEIGELARAVRRRVALVRSDAGGEDPAAELADVQLYVLHLANAIGVDLADAVAAKEQVNHARYGPSPDDTTSSRRRVGVG
jgi:NTP pyrophosphatase (non-canonical NTP hydrolase)/nucleoside 2-deoxyribosyltransferase